jgi:hypothetical protein
MRPRICKDLKNAYIADVHRRCRRMEGCWF